MTRRLLFVAVALAAVAIAAPSASAGDVQQKLLDQHTGSIVSVKFVLSLQLSMGGQTQDREISGAATGLVVDPVGLIVMDSQSLSPRGPRGMDIKASPTSIRVVFPGDPKEYEAVLGATDSRLGLSFVRIKDLEGKVLTAFDLEGDPEVKIGDRLYGVTRLGQGFDYAPVCQVADIIGWVTKPRKMWAVSGGAVDVGHPMLQENGTVVGFVIRQEGVGGGAGAFLLPLDVARGTIDRAGREAEKVLEEALEAEAEEEAADEADPAATDEPADETPAEPEEPEAPEAPEAD